jgi:hypothetical protein
MRSRSASAARATPLLATDVPVLAKAPVSKPVRSVSDCTMCTRETVVPNVAAVICACWVVVPLPNSAVPMASS